MYVILVPFITSLSKWTEVAKMANKLSIRYVFSFLEDPEYPSVGPHLKLLRATGLWHSSVKSFLSVFKKFLFYFTISFFFSQYIKCFIHLNPEPLKLILQYAPFHMGILKSCFFQKDFKNWKRLIEYMSTVERKQLEGEKKDCETVINDYINRNRKVSYFFWALAFFSNFSIFSEPYQKNQVNVNGTSVYLNIFDGYTPFSKEPPGYYASMCIQTFLGHIVSAYVVSWDTLVVSIMIFFAGQLKITRIYCMRMIEPKNPTKSHHNIAKCHEFHTALVE